MAWPMVEWVLDTNYADRFSNRPDIEVKVVYRLGQQWQASCWR